MHILDYQPFSLPKMVPPRAESESGQRFEIWSDHLPILTTTTTTTIIERFNVLPHLRWRHFYDFSHQQTLEAKEVLLKHENNNLFIGWFDPKLQKEHGESKTIPYADGLSYNTFEGWYSFRCDCNIRTVSSTTNTTNTNTNGVEEEIPLPVALSEIGPKAQPIAYESVIKAYLCKPNGGDLSSVSETQDFKILVKAIASLYARMMAGDPLFDILESLDLEASCETLVDGE